MCRTRGRYRIGPLRIDISDPFALTKLRMEYMERDELVVFPEVEELQAGVSSQFGSGAGDSASRHLFRTGEEFFTMREYRKWLKDAGFKKVTTIEAPAPSPLILARK